MKKILLFLYILAVISLFSGSLDYRFRGEEPTRMVMAYEMSYISNFSQPTYLGEEYYRKPPLFNWLIIGYSKLFGWEAYTGRLVSITFTVFVSLLIVWFSNIFVFKSWEYSVLSGLIFLSFIDVLFWYGFLAEIDMTLTFFVFSMIISLILALKRKSYVLFVFSGILTGFSFLLKGFPAFVFLLLTLFILTLYGFYKKYSLLWMVGGVFLSMLFSVVPVVLWILSLKNPETYIATLWSESFGRVEQSKDIFIFLKHIIMYPLLNIKQTLLISAFVLFIVFIKRSQLKSVSVPENVFILIFLFIINYLPYLISAGARGRYVLPLFPIVAILFSFLIHRIHTQKIFKIITGILLFSFIVRILVGLLYFPYETEKKGLYRKIAQHIVPTVKNGDVATNCVVHKGLIFYVDIMTQKIVLSERKNPNWDYFISCNKKLNTGFLISSYDYKSEKIYLYKRR